MSEGRLRLAPPADPGASGTALIYDSNNTTINNRNNNRHKMRSITTFYTNVADATFIVEWSDSSTGTLRNFSSTPIPAATVFERSVLLLPGRTRIYISTVTDPTTWQIATELVYDHALPQ